MSTDINDQSTKNCVANDYVEDIPVDLEYTRLQIWNHSDKFITFGGYFKDEKVKSPFSLQFEMPINSTQTLCLKITTILRHCEGCKSHRKTPYLWWIDNKDSSYEFKRRFCWECLTPLQRKMLSMIEN